LDQATLDPLGHQARSSYFGSAAVPPGTLAFRAFQSGGPESSPKRITDRAGEGEKEEVQEKEEEGAKDQDGEERKPLNL